MGEVELHAPSIGPFLECLGGELRAVVDRDGERGTGLLNGSIQGRDDVAAAKRKPRLQ